MPAVIQRLFTPDGEVMPTVQTLVRVEELFADPAREWEWDCDRDKAFVFATFEQADAAARQMGCGAYPVVRERDSREPIANGGCEHRAVTAALASESARAAGHTKAQNRRVTAQRRAAEDFRRLYEATCARLGEHDE
jgi:hypothetical protein